MGYRCVRKKRPIVVDLFCITPPLPQSQCCLIVDRDVSFLQNRAFISHLRTTVCVTSGSSTLRSGAGGRSTLCIRSGRFFCTHQTQCWYYDFVCVLFVDDVVQDRTVAIALTFELKRSLFKHLRSLVATSPASPSRCDLDPICL